VELLADGRVVGGSACLSGDLDDVYRHHQLDTDSIIAAGLDLLG
jgi:hypothetical protein